MKAVYDAGVSEIARDGDDKNGFIFPSYVDDIMGPELFDYGYGPFRWVCPVSYTHLIWVVLPLIETLCWLRCRVL